MYIPGAGSYYENTDSVGSMGQTESIYDSLDRRQHNRVVLQSSIQSAQYDEPDKDQSVQPLMLTGDQSDSQYYCGKLRCYALIEVLPE